MPPSRHIRFAPRADVRSMPAFMSIISLTNATISSTCSSVSSLVFVLFAVMFSSFYSFIHVFLPLHNCLYHFSHRALAKRRCLLDRNSIPTAPGLRGAEHLHGELAQFIL